MFWVYILHSNKTNRFYTGMTSDIDKRLEHHNSGANRSTRKKGPRVVVYKESFTDKKSAWLRERKIKSYKSGEAFKKLISHGGVA